MNKIKCFILQNIKTIFLALLFLLYLYKLRSFYVPLVMDDELGYWVNAAYFAGMDWSALRTIPYYSPGYSFFLAGLIKVFKDPLFCFRAALAFNTLLIMLSYLIMTKILERIIPLKSKIQTAFITFLVFLYPSIFIFAKTTMAEIFILFFYLLCVFNFIYLDKKKTMLLTFTQGVLTGGLYLIHMRNLGVMFACVFTMAIMCAYKELKWRNMLLFILIITGAVLISEYFKELLLNNVYLSPKAANNNFSQLVERALAIFTLEGAGRFLLTLLGHIYYVGMSFYLFSFLAVFYCAREIFYGVKTKKIPFVLLFILICAAGIFITSVIFTSGAYYDTQDPRFLIWGRYFEMSAGALLGAMGICFALQGPVKIKVICVISFFFILCASAFDIGLFYKVPSLSLIDNVDIMAVHPFHITAPAYLGLSIIACLYFFILFNWPQKKGAYLKQTLLLCALGIIFLYTGAVKVYKMANENYYDIYLPARELYGYTADKDKAVFLNNTKLWYWRKHRTALQFMLNKKPLYVEPPYEGNTRPAQDLNLDSGDIVIVPLNIWSDKRQEDFILKGNYGEYYVWTKK